MPNINIDKYGIFNIDVHKDRDFSMQMEMFDVANGVPYDITSITISSVIRKYDDLESVGIVEFTVNKTVPTMGLFTLDLSAELTSTIDEHNGYFDILVEDGSTRETWAKGKVDFLGAVTNHNGSFNPPTPPEDTNWYHNDALGLQGGNGGTYSEFYHLTATQYSNLGGTISHATLSNLQGGTVGEMYHLTSTEYTQATSSISSRILQGVTESINPATIGGASPSFTYDIDLDYNRHIIDFSSVVTGDTVTISLSNLKALGTVQSIICRVTTGADVGFTIVWPTGFTAPTLNADKETFVVFETWDDGVVWRELIGGEF